MNARLRAELTRRGLVFNDVDQAPFRKKLSGVYAAWKEKLGTRCWSLLEAAAGSLATAGAPDPVSGQALGTVGT